MRPTRAYRSISGSDSKLWAKLGASAVSRDAVVSRPGRGDLDCRFAIPKRQSRLLLLRDCSRVIATAQAAAAPRPRPGRQGSQRRPRRPRPDDQDGDQGDDDSNDQDQDGDQGDDDSNDQDQDGDQSDDDSNDQDQDDANNNTGSQMRASHSCTSRCSVSGVYACHDHRAALRRRPRRDPRPRPHMESPPPTLIFNATKISRVLKR